MKRDTSNSSTIGKKCAIPPQAPGTQTKHTAERCKQVLQNNTLDEHSLSFKRKILTQLNMAVEILLSTVLAVSTVIYTGINLMLWLESRATRKQKLTPQIIAFLKSAENHIMLELHIKNIGEGVANNLRINVLQDYERMGKPELLMSEIGVVKNGFNFFPPQYELKYYIISLTELIEKNKNGRIKLEFNYESSDNRRFSNIYDLPFIQIFDQNYSNPPETYMGQIPFYLKEINSTLKKIEERKE